MASLALPFPSTSSSSNSLSSPASLPRRTFVPNRSLRSPLNVVKCEVTEPINGKPIVPVLTEGTLPKLLNSRCLTDAVRNDHRPKIFSGLSNPALSQEIAWYMGLDLGKINIKRFADGEIYVHLQESVRGCDVYLVQSTCPPAIERLSSGLFQEVIITNTIPVTEKNYFPQLTVLSVANLLGETIWRVHDDCSVSSIFQ
nr:ribose-phosphate pyrophosphokinase 1-like [Ipomoea batatas]